MCPYSAFGFPEKVLINQTLLFFVLMNTDSCHFKHLNEIGYDVNFFFQDSLNFLKETRNKTTKNAYNLVMP